MALSCLLRSLSSSRAKSFLGDRDRLLEGECLCGLLLLYGDLALSLPGDLLGDLDLRLLGDLDLRLGDDRFCERLYSGDLQNMNKHFYFLLHNYESLRIFNIHGGSIFIDFKEIIQSRNKIINNFFYISTYHQSQSTKKCPYEHVKHTALNEIAPTSLNDSTVFIKIH